MMILIILILIITSLGLMLWGIFGFKFYSSPQLRLPAETLKYSRKINAGRVINNIFPFTRKFLEKSGLEAKIKNRLDAAHLRVNPNTFFNFKLLFMIILAIAAPIVVGGTNPMAGIIGCAIGYLVPEIWLTKKISKRKDAIARVLPETVDLLGLCVEAGLDFTTATKWVIDKVPTNPLIEELAFVLEEIKWGKPRTQALRDMAKRLNVSEVSSFVQTLVQAERMGTPVSEAFMILSEDTRLQRFHRGERFAMQAPIKILIPLIFCILPVIAIVIGGPIFLQFMQGGMLKGIGG